MFGPFHGILIYGWNRLCGQWERDGITLHEIQRRANLVPPAEREAELARLVARRSIIADEAWEQHVRKPREKKRFGWQTLVLLILLAMFLNVLSNPE